MSKKISDQPFSSKINRNDRFAQMSHQEKLIEQKKREIQARLEAKDKSAKLDTKATSDKKQIVKSSDSNTGDVKDVKNVFSNDGSFLNQFKQMKEAKKLDSKFKPFNRHKARHDKGSNDDKNKTDKWNINHRSPSPKDRQTKRPSRFDKIPNFEPKITINTSFSSTLIQEPQLSQMNINTQDVIGQPLLKNVISPQFQTIPEQTTITETVISASPVLLNVPPPQFVQASNTLVLNSATTTQNVLVSTVLPLVTPVPPPCLPTVELSNIPPPNPIQIQNIPQPEPLNAMNIPQPAPIQVQNIPTPNSLQLNKIPTPKPLDLLSIPTPVDENNMSNPDFIKNIPPPNKSIPPPLIDNSQILLPQSQTITVSSTQNVLIHNIPPPDTFSSVTVALPVTIPSLMAQPILPPSGMVNVNCPPPLLPQVATFVGQPPPPVGGIGLPPPSAVQILGPIAAFNEQINSVFPTGTPEYEAMASLGRMVAECGDTFEDVVRQRKEQDSRLWFLFDKDSAAYKEYRQYVNKLKMEITAVKEPKIKAEDIYEPEMALEDNDIKDELDSYQQEVRNEEATDKKRKRKSRWGNQENTIAPPTVVYAAPPVLPVPPPQSNLLINTDSNPLLLTKVTRNDPQLIQYAMNTYNTTNLSEEDWKKVEDNYKISLLYQDMVKKKVEVDRLKMAGKHKYDYDSDEDVDGGTWEHKVREKEMLQTQTWALELTKHAEGKHHIGDFLPPEELQKFMEKNSAAKEGRTPNISDYKEFQIKEDNIGFKMLQKLGWSEGEGLGSGGTGIVEPINKGAPREHTQGLGLNESQDDEDEYQSYRKRMMLAYRFRPNPLNNPRRPYY